MAYTLPRHVSSSSVADPVVRFIWDDWHAGQDMDPTPLSAIETLAAATLRSKIVTGIGVYEWIIGRFSPVIDEPIPFQIAEAAWCAAVHRAYMDYVELDRGEWLGLVRGPLWGAMTWLIPMLFSGDNDPEVIESGLDFLPRLARHVLPNPRVFTDWLDVSVQRLVNLYPAPLEDPLEDLFSEREEERRGPLIAREVLDPQVPYDPAAARTLVHRYLRGVDYRNNPFLRTPEEMIAEGFIGTPYAL